MKPTEEQIKEAYDKCDGCMSCGWKGMLHEIIEDFQPTGNGNEYRAGCSRDDWGDVSDHRGYYIYPDVISNT